MKRRVTIDGSDPFLHPMGLEDAEPESETQIRRLRCKAFAIAYRMLGTVSDADDLSQEAMQRLHRARQEGQVIDSPSGFVATAVTRLSIDQLRSARVRREEYYGPWLPEPVVDKTRRAIAESVEMAESLSMAFLVLLETLSPLERAIFLLREAFDYRYDEIAGIVGRSEENCRQIFSRANRHVEAGRPRFEASARKADGLADRFFAATAKGNLEELERLLAQDAVFSGDGGGKAAATTRSVTGRERVARLMIGFMSRRAELGAVLERVLVNGQPGALVLDRERRVISVLQLDIVDGLVHVVRGVVNPDKLDHLAPVPMLGRIRRPQTKL